MRPAATKAHCAMEGYGSLMAAASGERRGLRRGLDVRWTRDGRLEDVAMLASVVVLSAGGSAGGCLRYGVGFPGTVLRA